MGLGSQPPLPVTHKNRRPIPYPLPRSDFTTSSLAPPILLPHSDLPLHPARTLARPVLACHIRQFLSRHSKLADPTKSLSPCARNRLHRTHPVRLARRPQPNPRDPKAHKHRRHRRSQRRKVW
jgi:hypothetical protein